MDVNIEAQYADAIINIVYNASYGERPKPEISDKIEALRHHSALKLFVPLNCSETIHSRESKTDLEGEVRKFLRGDRPVLFLQGDSGSGKSTFCTHLAVQLLNDHKSDNRAPLPVLIRLGGAGATAQGNRIIEDEFERFGLSALDVAVLKKDGRFVFILDGYDELGQKINLYNSNRLGEWNAKSIITCRTQYLEKERDYQLLLAKVDPIVHEADLNSFKILYIVPLSDEKVEEYLKMYSLQDESVWKDWEEYKQKIVSIYNLKELSSNPLLLHIITRILPVLIKKSPIALFTRSMLYEAFFTQWFEREQNRLKDCSIDKETFFEFAEELGFQMFLEGKTDIEYVPPRISLYAANVDQPHPLESFFTNRDIDILKARSGCPIQRTGDNTYRFIHKSFQEFCVARKLTRDIEKGIWKNLNGKLLSGEPGILNFFKES